MQQRRADAELPVYDPYAQLPTQALILSYGQRGSGKTALAHTFFLALLRRTCDEWTRGAQALLDRFLRPRELCRLVAQLSGPLVHAETRSPVSEHQPGFWTPGTSCVPDALLSWHLLDDGPLSPGRTETELSVLSGVRHVCVQYCRHVPRKTRTSADVVVVHSERDKLHLGLIYNDHFGSVFATFLEFGAAVERLRAHQALVLQDGAAYVYRGQALARSSSTLRPEPHDLLERCECVFSRTASFYTAGTSDDTGSTGEIENTGTTGATGATGTTN